MARLIFLSSAAALLWERLWARFWIAISALCAVSFPALAGYPLPLSLSVLLVTLALLIPAPAFRFPRRADVWRKMEEASHLPHNPLQTLHDAPATGDSALWRIHQIRAEAALQNLRAYAPHPGVAARDRFFLRYVAAALLIAGVLLAGRETSARLAAALHADISSAPAAPLALDLWIVPPAYTHLPAAYLATAQRGALHQNEPVTIPSGSTLKLRLSGARLAPHLSYAGETQTLAAPSEKNYTLDLPLARSGALSLRTAFLLPLAAWDIAVTQDGPPAVRVTKVEPTPAAATKITYAAADDYGIVKLTGAVAAGDETFRFDIPPAHNGEGVHIEDLAAAKNAGKSASLTLEAEDAAGHKTQSAATLFILPERIFSNPAAQRIAAARKQLFTNQTDAARGEAVAALADVAMKPALYGGKFGVLLALNSAILRLQNGEDVSGLLWNIAVDLEDGGLSAKQVALQDALSRLSDALEDPNLSREKLQELLDNVKTAMRAYAQSLAQNVQQQKAPVLSPGLAARFRNNIDVRALFAQMQHLLQSGSRQDMKKMAEALKQQLSGMGMSAAQQEKQAKALQALQAIQDVVEGQQALFDKINHDPDAGDLREGKGTQDALRGKLEGALKSLGALTTAPDPLKAAPGDMGRSGKALGAGDAPASLAAQKDALDKLQQGLDQAVKDMAQSILSAGGGGGSSGADPLGRALSGDTVKLPDQQQQGRIQQIIDELRRRANEPNRQKVERDYLDRLLGTE